MRPNIKSRDMYHDGLKSSTWIRIRASSSRFVRYFFKQYRLQGFAIFNWAGPGQTKARTRTGTHRKAHRRQCSNFLSGRMLFGNNAVISFSPFKILASLCKCFRTLSPPNDANPSSMRLVSPGRVASILVRSASSIFKRFAAEDASAAFRFASFAFNLSYACMSTMLNMAVEACLQ